MLTAPTLLGLLPVLVRKDTQEMEKHVQVSGYFWNYFYAININLVTYCPRQIAETGKVLPGQRA